MIGILNAGTGGGPLPAFLRFIIHVSSKELLRTMIKNGFHFVPLLFTLLFLQCRTFRYCPFHSSKKEHMQFDLQGHRGCRGLLPENTWPAMEKALDLGVTTLELDVVISADNQVVVSHEPWMSHEIATHPNGQPVSEAEEKSLNLYRMTYHEIQSYDVGMRFHPRFPYQQKIPVQKPLLSDLFDRVENYMKTHSRTLPYFNIETKCLPVGDGLYHPKPERFVELLMEVIHSKKMGKRVVIQSFDFRTLRYLHQNDPSIQTSVLVDEGESRNIDVIVSLLGFIPSVYSPHYSLVDDDLIRECHKKKMRIIPWTVNSKKEIERFKRMGVDGIITDYPDLYRDL
jgi:glycerophosphoryl diester phosphodiesterase